jgi:hypothetical protein
VATTSSGRSRRPELWFAGAAALAAAAFFEVADRGAGSASGHRSLPTSVTGSVTAAAADTRIAIPDYSSKTSIGADAIERSLLVADPGTRDLVLERMLTSWTPQDPQAAARFAELQPDPFLREVALRTVAQVWAKSDSGSAAQWGASLGDEAERSRVIELVALAMGDSDPRAALALLSRNGSGTRSDDARIGVIASWASRDFAAAQSWATAEPPSPLRDDIVQRLAFLRAETDPLAATLLVNEMLSDDAARRDAYASIVGLWVARDPDGARRWAAYADLETRRRVDAEIAIAQRDAPAD